MDDEKFGCSLLSVATAIILLLGCCFAVGCDATYSEGYRDGTVQKLSHRGWFVKSWEGELALSGFKAKGENISNVWAFSIDDKAFIEQLQALPPDAVVRIHYHQVMVNGRWRHDSAYRVVKIERITTKEQERQ